MPQMYSSPRRQLQAAALRAYGSQGDPFLGALIRGAGALIGKGIRAVRGVGRKALPGGSVAETAMVATGAGAVGAAAPGAIGEFFGGAKRLLGVNGGGQYVENAAGCPTAKIVEVREHQRLIPIDPRTGKPRRRINVLNVSALSRATRRLGGFQKRAKRVEAQLSKIAPRRRTRRKSQTTTVRCN